MLILSTPFHYEQDQGYLGRIMRLNGASDRKSIERLMRIWAGVPGSGWRDVPCVELLGKISGMTVTEFVVQHTLLPLRRGVVSYHPEVRHGCESNRQMLWTTAMRLARTGAYFCEKCVAEDVIRRGLSYWRRAHQMPGEFLCTAHSQPLHYVEKKTAFFNTPHAFLETASHVSQDWATESMGNPVVRRYLDICACLTERPYPLLVRTVSLILRERARLQGLQVNSGRVKYPLLSDLAITRCGRPWLATVLPTLANKAFGELSYQLDGVFFLKTSSSSVMAYALAAALLFESADEAMRALSEQDSLCPDTRPRKTVNISTEDLLAAYVQARGDYSKAALGFDCTYQTAVSRYKAIGLPNLQSRGGKRLLDAAMAFYVERRSWSESIRIGGIDHDVMENIVRNSGAPLAQVLQEIHRPRGPGSRARRLQRLAPTDIEEYDGTLPTKYSLRPRETKRRLRRKSG